MVLELLESVAVITIGLVATLVMLVVVAMEEIKEMLV
jgi:hypothetical protein